MGCRLWSHAEGLQETYPEASAHSRMMLTSDLCADTMSSSRSMPGRPSLYREAMHCTARSKVPSSLKSRTFCSAAAQQWQVISIFESVLVISSQTSFKTYYKLRVPWISEYLLQCFSIFLGRVSAR